jgi:Reverse transcriptase (RNA-dependent DNA polymerase)
LGRTYSLHLVLPGGIEWRGNTIFHPQARAPAGDPLSPMLFILATDVLQEMLQGANRLLHNTISKKIESSIVALQYADDMVVITSPDPEPLLSTSLIIDTFSRASGLRVNAQKNSFIPFNLMDLETQTTTLITRYKKQSLPIKYLGLPLTVTKPTQDLFIPLIEQVEHRIEGWQGKLIFSALCHAGLLYGIFSIT